MSGYDVFEQLDGTYAIMGPNGIVLDGFESLDAAQKAAEEYSKTGTITVKDEKIQLPDPDPDPQAVENLVDKSGVRMWQPKTWRDFIVEHRKISIAVAALILFSILMLIAAISFAIQNSSLQTQKTELTKENDRIEAARKEALAELDDKNNQIYVCQESLKTAWKAWNRRNQVFIDTINEIFTTDAQQITDDNTLAALDFLNTQDCNPTMDENDIFTSTGG